MSIKTRNYSKNSPNNATSPTFTIPAPLPSTFYVPDIEDFWSLLKPRVMTLVVFTSFVGMVVAPGTIHFLEGFTGIVAIAIGAGAAGAINMWYDRDIDSLMARTKTRPLPAGRIEPSAALGFGICLSLWSILLLGLGVNWLAAQWLAFSILFYSCFYTMVLKRHTIHNIVIGGAAGAFPPVIGWLCVTGEMTWEPWTLFLIIFMWTPPHFWALALSCYEDYKKANVPMAPGVRGVPYTKQQILIYAGLLYFCLLLPYWCGVANEMYLGTAVLAGGNFLWRAYKLWRSNNNKQEGVRFFKYSIIFLFLIFVALLADNWLFIK